MPPISSRTPFTPFQPYRTVRPATAKIIFLSMEGCVTEEEYFERLTELFPDVASKIKFISVQEDAVKIPYKRRRQEQKVELSKTQPEQLLQKIEKFRKTHDDIYQFSAFPDDEFWLVMDVDDHWSTDQNAQGVSKLDKWNDTVQKCDEKGYYYAVSNPFFEVWLLLHHDDVNDEDKAFAVTDTVPYNSDAKAHFKARLQEAGAPMKDGKKIHEENYRTDNIFTAVERAKALHLDKTEKAPKSLSTTVYLLVDKILELQKQSDATSVGISKQ